MDNLIRKKINVDYAVTDDISMNLNTKFSLLFKNAIKNPDYILSIIIRGRKKTQSLYSQPHTCAYFEPESELEKLYQDNHPSHEHGFWLQWMTKALNLKTVVELGVGHGGTTLPFLYAVRAIGGHLHSFDIKECNEAKQKVQNHKLNDYWTFTQTDDLKAQWDSPIDHLYIDSIHSKSHVLKQLNKYEKFVKSNGIITLHDIVWAQYDNEGNNLEPSSKSNAVWLAIKEYFSDRNDVQIERAVNCRGLAIIQKLDNNHN